MAMKLFRVIGHDNQEIAEGAQFSDGSAVYNGRVQTPTKVGATFVPNVNDILAISGVDHIEWVTP